MKRKLQQWAARGARLLVCGATISLPMMAQQAPPTGDTFALSTTPKTNYGPSPLLAVTNGGTTFIQFNLSALPANATVSKATLRLFTDAVTAAGSFDVYEVDTPWTERALNFSNAPTPGISATGGKSVAISSSSCNQFVMVDITTLVQEWVNGTVANNGIALKLTSATGTFAFDSKEAEETSHEPELEISLATAGPQGPTGATGPAGPQGIPGNLNPGSPLYVQNSTTTQAGASFNIDGSGTVGGALSAKTVNSTNGYQIGSITELNADGKTDIMLGQNAGNATITGGSSQMVGDYAGHALTTGNADVFLGSFAGALTTTGNGDVYVGWASGESATTAAYNTFLGAQTGALTTTGVGNVFAGFSAGLNNTTGTNNTFVGNNSGVSNSTGNNNLFLGYLGGFYNSTGSGNIYVANTGVGAENGTIRIGSNQSAAFMSGIFGSTVSAGQPVFVDNSGHLGTGGGIVNTTGGYQINGATILNQDKLSDTMIGNGAGNANITGGDSQMIGRNTGAALTSGNADVFIGGAAGASTTTGNGDVFVGWTSGESNTTGAYNTFLGAQTGSFNTTGSGDLYLGFDAGISNTTGGNNIYLAHGGLDGESNTIRVGNGSHQAAFIGGIYGATVSAGQPVYIDNSGHLGTGGGVVNTTGGYQINGTTILNQDKLNDTMIGNAGNPNITGGDSQMIGHGAGSALTSGNADVFIGSGAGGATTTGNGDVFVGWTSGTSNTSGAFNTFLGAQSGFYNTSGSGDLYLGFNAGASNTTGSNNIYLNHGGLDGESNTIRIGNGNQGAAYIAGIYGVTSGSGVPIYINSNGQLGTQTSSQRYKENIRDMGNSTEALMKLRPVTFYYKHEYDKGVRTLQYGLIAEEVAKVFPELVAYNPDGTPYTVRYQFLSSMLLNEVQKQYQRSQQVAEVLHAQQQKIEQQQQQISLLTERLSQIEKLLSSGPADREGRPANSQGN